MAILPSILTTAIPSTEFSFKNGVFSAEASDLGGRIGFAQIYDDAADCGLAIRSARTGRVVVYALVEERRDADDDVQAWHYEPIFEHERVAAGTRVVVFND